jgi:hypothetical protein
MRRFRLESGEETRKKWRKGRERRQGRCLLGQADVMGFPRDPLLPTVGWAEQAALAASLWRRLGAPSLTDRRQVQPSGLDWWTSEKGNTTSNIGEPIN